MVTDANRALVEYATAAADEQRGIATVAVTDQDVVDSAERPVGIHLVPVSGM